MAARGETSQARKAALRLLARLGGKEFIINIIFYINDYTDIFYHLSEKELPISTSYYSRKT
ncbi:hypothetical protein DSM107003_48350 [Trichormus variabilis SAG 1403-4b]|uniref:Uncharacterized protein n=1 Tax=Trichormus variabilis SAG 1403-4b TaxID=447716 RepID=A0A433UFT6_ANAVA|nr:hypothetical protein DSM107003_48350 [Trichormus variabilis SAG 1403-4b]